MIRRRSLPSGINRLIKRTQRKSRLVPPYRAVAEKGIPVIAIFSVIEKLYSLASEANTASIFSASLDLSRTHSPRLTKNLP